MAKSLFKERWQRQWRQFSKYLKYVFNDHAILALVFLLGAGLVAYQNFWSTMQVTMTNQVIWTGIVICTTILWRTPATFIKEEDAIYFLGDEGVLRQLRQYGLIYSLLIRTALQVILLVLFLPVLYRLFSRYMILLWLLMGFSVVLALLFMSITWRQASHFPRGTYAQDMTNWSRIARLESKRVQRIVHVFSWFVDIPEQKVTIKTYKWSDWVIAHWSKHKGLTTLYVTTFMRTNDYVQLWLTILVLGSVLMATLSGWLLIGILMGLLYVFIIQVLPIMMSYQQRVFDHLIPVTMRQRQRAFHQLSLPLGGGLLGCWLIVGLLCVDDIKLVLMMQFTLVLWGLALVFLYSDRKAENMFKRR